MNASQTSLWSATGLTLSALALASLSACGGGSSTASQSSSTPMSITGSVVDGYIQGATVCLDINGNGACDSGEPSATSDSAGSYTLSGVAAADAASAPVIAVVPSTAIDSDAPGVAVGSNFILSAPAGKSVITPLTTLVHQTMLKDATQTADTAAAALKTTVSSLGTTDVFADYVKGGDTNAHNAARVVANSFKANFDALHTGGTAGAGKDRLIHIALGDVARQALMSQGTAPNPLLPVGSEDPATLRAQLAARTSSSAAATQDISISFDLVNGAGATVHCGDPITVTNSKLYDFSAQSAAPVKLVTPTTQSTDGQLTDTRFYIANVVLLDASGNATPLVLTDNANQSAAGGVALIDFGHNTAIATAPVSCTTGYYTTLTGKVAPGTYTGISMTVGVPARSADLALRLNHTNAMDITAPLPLQSADMAWSWQSGRKFMKIQFRPTTGLTTYAASTGAYVSGSTTTDWNVHVGSTGCAGNPDPARKDAAGNLIPVTETACTNPNRLGLKFDAFNAASQKITLDIAALFQQAELDFTYAAPPGCMSGVADPECAPIFKALGLDLATGRTQAPAAQTVFSVR